MRMMPGLIYLFLPQACLPGDVVERETDAVPRVDVYGYEGVCEFFPEFEHVPVEVPGLVVERDAQEAPHLGGREDKALAFMADDVTDHPHGAQTFLVIETADLHSHMLHPRYAPKTPRLYGNSKKSTEII